MERQTKHRILGVLVLVGLVVISLPFLQTSNELPSEAALTKAPAFPDQAVQTNNTETAALGQEISSEPIPFTVSTTPLITPIPDNMPSPAETPVVVAAPSVEQSTPPETIKSEVKKVHLEDLPKGSERDTADAAHKADKPKAKIAVKKSRSRMVDGYQILDRADISGADKTGYANLKSKAWVVQLGSFKSKSNAMRLVNVLRTRGYHTYIEQGAAGKHSLTKVLVGPEHKKDSAHTLAARLEREVHIRGIVVNYKPLAL